MRLYTVEDSGVLHFTAVVAVATARGRNLVLARNVNSFYSFFLLELISLTRVTKSYLLALGTTQISSYFTKH